MRDRLEALMEVTLAIAGAAAEHDGAFADTLGTRLRDALQRSSAAPVVFSETFRWLERFEEGETAERSAQRDGAEESKDYVAAGAAVEPDDGE